MYPSIDKAVVSAPIYAFDKLDGSNIRAEWTRKSGFAKFGTRRRLLDENEPVLGEAVTLFNEKYADDLNRIFRKERYEKATAFFEFAGPSSFAGFHEDEKHDITLIDVHKFKQGILPPRDFLKVFAGKVDTAPMLYHGNPNSEFLKSVRERTLEGMTFEGVVCKGGLDSRKRLIVFKVKSHDWLARLKDKCGDDEAMFEKLQ